MTVPVIKFRKLFFDSMIPKRQSDGAAGFDLHTTEEILVPVGGSAVAPTGIAVALPDTHVGLIRDRSGEALRHGIHVLAGVIDEDYRGEIKVILHNTGEQSRTYHPGDRVAQMIVIRYEGNSVEATDLDNTGRGRNGFGSTGV